MLWVDVLPAGDVGVHVGVVTFGVGAPAEQLGPGLAGLGVDPPHAPALAPTVALRRQPLPRRRVTLTEVPEVVDSHRYLSVRPSSQACSRRREITHRRPTRSAGIVPSRSEA